MARAIIDGERLKELDVGQSVADASETCYFRKRNKMGQRRSKTRSMKRMAEVDEWENRHGQGKDCMKVGEIVEIEPFMGFLFHMPYLSSHSHWHVAELSHMGPHAKQGWRRADSRVMAHCSMRNVLPLFMHIKLLSW